MADLRPRRKVERRYRPSPDDIVQPGLDVGGLDLARPDVQVRGELPGSRLSSTITTRVRSPATRVSVTVPETPELSTGLSFATTTFAVGIAVVELTTPSAATPAQRMTATFTSCEHRTKGAPASRLGRAVRPRIGAPD